MTVGTRDPYLALPEDINRPKPGYFQDVFHLVHAYLELVQHVGDSLITPGKGLIKLYSYRMGVLNCDTDLLEENYLALLTHDQAQRSMLCAYGQSLIAYNLVTLYRLLANTLCRDISRGFGDDRCLTLEVLQALNYFAKQQETARASRVEIHDNMSALVETCRYNAVFVPPAGVTSTQAMLRAIDALDREVAEIDRLPPALQRKRLYQTLQIVFYLGVRYYHLNLLRFSDEVIDRSYDRCLDITDLTLAAVPFDTMLVYACADETTSISRWGVEYVQSLEAVMTRLGGVQFQAVLAVDANGNKGVI